MCIIDTVYEVNLRPWQVGRVKPRLGSLAVEEMAETLLTSNRTKCGQETFLAASQKGPASHASVNLPSQKGPVCVKGPASKVRPM